MNILLNASNLRFGGGVTVSLNLLNSLVPLRPEDHFFLIHPQGVGYEPLIQNWNLTPLPVPDAFHKSYITKIRYNEYIFRSWCRDYSIDKIVSLGNVAFRADHRPQLLYIQMSHLVYHDSPAWKRMDWKSFMTNSLMDQWCAFHLKYATSYAVQTSVMKDRLIKRFEMQSDKVHIIPNAADLHTEPAPYCWDGKTLRLLFLSKLYSHKNFDCLLPLGKLIKEHSLPVTISLTLNKDESERTEKLLKCIKSEGLQHIFPNIGHVPFDSAGSVMQDHDGLFLPTLLESFSGTYAEALKCGRPIFTSHYDFAVNLLGDSAFFFDPLNADTIFKVLQDAIANPQAVAEKAEAAATIGALMPGWPEIAQQFSQLIDTFV